MRSAEKNAKSKRILLVDDDASRRNTRAMILLTHGYDVDCVATMSAALSDWPGTGPDLLLIGVPSNISEWRSLERIGKVHPKQRFGFLLNEGEKLCAVQFDGELLLPEEGPGDFISQVATLLNPRTHWQTRFLAVGAAS